MASWTIETKADDWQTRTSLRFPALRGLHPARPRGADLAHGFHAVWIYWRLVFNGTIAQFTRANWRFAAFITYPHFVLLLEALGSAAIAFVFPEGPGGTRLPDPFGIAAQLRCSSPSSVRC